MLILSKLVTAQCSKISILPESAKCWIFPDPVTCTYMYIHVPLHTVAVIEQCLTKLAVFGLLAEILLCFVLWG